MCFEAVSRDGMTLIWVWILVENEWRELRWSVDVSGSITISDFVVRSEKGRRGSSEGCHYSDLVSSEWVRNRVPLICQKAEFVN